MVKLVNYLLIFYVGKTLVNRIGEEKKIFKIMNIKI